MGAYTNRVTWEPMRSINASTFTGSFLALGTPLVHPSYICKVVNNSDVLVTISIDGTTPIDVCPAGSFWLYDEGKAGYNGQYPAIPSNTQFYVSGSAGTGLVYLVSQYIVTV